MFGCKDTVKKEKNPCPEGTDCGIVVIHPPQYCFGGKKYDSLEKLEQAERKRIRNQLCAALRDKAKDRLNENMRMMPGSASFYAHVQYDSLERLLRDDVDFIRELTIQMKEDEEELDAAIARLRSK